MKKRIAWNKKLSVRIICQNCQKEVFVKPSNAKTRKFCSLQCKYAWQKTQPPPNKGKSKYKLKSCEICGESFKPNFRKRRFCSSKCKSFYQKGINHPMYGKKSTPEQLIEMSKRSKKLWENDEFKEKNIKATLATKKPTGIERRVLKIIQENNLPYKYVGNGSVLIGFKNPDFININGKKILIEVGNIYNHQNNYIEKRKAHFAQYGWKTYILLDDQPSKKKILNFFKENNI